MRSPFLCPLISQHVMLTLVASGGAAHQASNLPPLFDFTSDELRNLPASVDISKLTINAGGSGGGAGGTSSSNGNGAASTGSGAPNSNHTNQSSINSNGPLESKSWLEVACPHHISSFTFPSRFSLWKLLYLSFSWHGKQLVHRYKWWCPVLLLVEMFWAVNLVLFEK